MTFNSGMAGKVIGVTGMTGDVIDDVVGSHRFTETSTTFSCNERTQFRHSLRSLGGNNNNSNSNSNREHWIYASENKFYLAK